MHAVWDLGFTVQGLGSRGLGFRVYCPSNDTHFCGGKQWWHNYGYLADATDDRETSHLAYMSFCHSLEAGIKALYEVMHGCRVG